MVWVGSNCERVTLVTIASKRDSAEPKNQNARAIAKSIENDCMFFSFFGYISFSFDSKKEKEMYKYKKIKL
jgi:hypothetical protein